MPEDSRKRSIYFPADLLDMITQEAERLDRSFSWVVSRCVRIGIKEIQKSGGVNEKSARSD